MKTCWICYVVGFLFCSDNKQRAPVLLHLESVVDEVISDIQIQILGGSYL